MQKSQQKDLILLPKMSQIPLCSMHLKRHPSSKQLTPLQKPHLPLLIKTLSYLKPFKKIEIKTQQSIDKSFNKKEINLIKLHSNEINHN
jgi:hypothetical protein